MTAEEYAKLSNSSAQQPTKETPVEDSQVYSAQVAAKPEPIDKLRSVYLEWLTFYGKPFSEERYEIFAQHFREAESHFKKTGEEMRLSEYADMTEEEYNALTRTSPQTSEATVAQTNKVESKGNAKLEVVDRIRVAYLEWCSHYKKTADEYRFKIFSEHFCEAEAYWQKTGTAIQLNEYADLTLEEYNKLTGDLSLDSAAEAYVVETPSRSHQTKKEVQDSVRSVYVEWSNFYGRPVAEERYKVFIKNFREAEDYWKETGMALKLNEYADMTEEEYRRMKIKSSQASRSVIKESQQEMLVMR